METTYAIHAARQLIATATPPSWCCPVVYIAATSSAGGIRLLGRVSKVHLTPTRPEVLLLPFFNVSFSLVCGVKGIHSLVVVIGIFPILCSIRLYFSFIVIIIIFFLIILLTDPVPLLHFPAYSGYPGAGCGRKMLLFSETFRYFSFFCFLLEENVENFAILVVFQLIVFHKPLNPHSPPETSRTGSIFLRGPVEYAITKLCIFSVCLGLM